MADRIGQQLDKYRITRLIGRGGFADVYLGEHIYLRTPAAIKVLATRLSSPDDLENFLKEARIIAQLLHPYIVRVLDFGVDGETPFLVMEYAPNGTLRERHRRGTQLPLSTTVAYVKQVAEALQYAHSEKFIHRDVKPENMLVGRRNEILLSDFGIALIAQSSRYQSTQDVTGTIAYMSPEQIQGKPRPASDQYSLAVNVYEWLSGEQPFHGSFTELCAQHMFAPPPPLHEKLPDISQDVEQVVMTALAKDPKQRFGSVQAFANALEQAGRSSSKAVISSPPSPQPQPIEAPPTSQPQVEATPLETPPHSQPRSAEAVPVETPLTSQPKSVETPPTPPTQYAPPPPLAPTQLASVSSLPKTVPDIPLGSAFQEKPVTQLAQQRQATGIPSVQQPSKISDETAKVWGIGRRQIIAMLVGIILYVSLFNVFPLLFGYRLLLRFIVPVFFGVVFGPWVGLVVGCVGEFVGQPLLAHQFLWTQCAGAASIGFIAGLVMLKTKGRYNTIANVALASIIGTAGLAIGIGFILATLNAFGLFLAGTLADAIVTLIMLPILLLVYDKIANRKNA
jgi:serine/threonine protein kinase